MPKYRSVSFSKIFACPRKNDPNLTISVGNKSLAINYRSYIEVGWL